MAPPSPLLTSQYIGLTGISVITPFPHPYNQSRDLKREIHVLLKNALTEGQIVAPVGGFEIGGIAGCILAGACHRRPVVIDGFISTAGALIAHALSPAVSDCLFAGHCSEESGHRAMLRYLGLEPLLDLRLRLGEGTGGALAIGVIESATRVFKEVLTFEEAGVSSGSNR